MFYLVARFPLQLILQHPEGVAESMHISINPQTEQAQDQLEDAFGKTPVTLLFDPDNKLKPGETMYDRMNRMGPIEDTLQIK